MVVAVHRFISQIFNTCISLYTFMGKRWLRASNLGHENTGACQPLQEAILVGFFLLRSGAVEAVLYDTMIAHIERREYEHLPKCQAGAETAEDKNPSDSSPRSIHHR
jgi:hypothetical protein